MEALYHGSQVDAMPCTRNRADARPLLDGDKVLVKLTDTAITVGYGILPLGIYALRYVWTHSRLRGR